MKQKLLTTMLAVTCLVGSSYAQTRQVSGKVTSSDGAPISGASISVVGTTNATQSDASGNFKISVAPGATLNVTYVGYAAQKVSIGNSSTLSIVLVSDENMIDDVIVTAMGVTRQKRSLTTATQEVKASELTQASNSNLATALQGKVSGVEIVPSSGMPGASAKITIRGSRSFTGDNTPLYVVDGMPIASTSDISTGNSVTGSDYANRGLDIDPNDIESINILKGQAASALYGMRASNGVFIITTKSGKGAGKGKAQITFNSNAAFDVVSVLPDFQTTYAQGAGGAYNPVASTSWGPKIQDLIYDPVYGGETVNDYTQVDGMKPGMYYVTQRALAGLDPWVKPGIYNNAKAFLQTGATYNNAINVAQGFDIGHYSFSLGATNSSGIVPSTGLDRYNMKMSTELNLGNKWKTGVTGNYINSKLTKQSGANNGLVATFYPAPASYDLKGIPSHIFGDPYKQNNYRGTAGFDNAYWAVANNVFSENNQRFFGNGFLQFSTNVADNQKLILKYQLGVDSYTTNYTDLWGYGHANGLGEVKNYNVSVTELNSLATASYNWEINEDLIFDALIGNEIVNRNRRTDDATGLNFNFPGWNSINNASTYSAYQSLRNNRTFGTFGSLSLAYKNMLFLNATGRNDIVSSMPRNNRSFFYPSVSGAFVFTALEGVKNNVLTFGKLRAAYAEVGQAGDYYESYYEVPTYGGGFSSGTPIIYPVTPSGGNSPVTSFTPSNVLYDPNLRPQNTKSYELGADLTFFNGLFDLSYTFSRQDVKDQIFAVPLAGSSGYSSLVTNGGKVHTNAHEFTLNVAPYRDGDFKWDFSFNFSKIDNYVDELADGVNSIFLGGFTEPQVRAGIGDKYPVIYGVSYLRNDLGQIVVDADGMPQIGEEKVIGSVSPNFLLGFNTRFEYKKFRLAAVFEWKDGGQMYSGTAGILDFYGVTQKSADYRSGTPFLFEEAAVKEVSPGVYAPNDILISPSDAFSYFDIKNTISESSIFGTSFVKLREVSLGYPVYTTSKFKIDVNAFARNIILWSELKGFDPEVSQGNTNMSGAFERFSLPGTSSFGLGLNFKF